MDTFQIICHTYNGNEVIVFFLTQISISDFFIFLILQYSYFSYCFTSVFPFVSKTKTFKWISLCSILYSLNWTTELTVTTELL